MKREPHLEPRSDRPVTPGWHRRSHDPLRQAVLPAAIYGALAFTGPSPLAAQDLVVLKTGESAAAVIETVTDNILTFALVSNVGPAGGTARRTVPMEQVDYLEWEFEPGEEAAYEGRADLGAAALQEWWDHHFAHLHRPRSRAAAFGNALGRALLREGETRAAERALGLFDRIADRAWSPADAEDARRGRLEALIALGDLVTATEEAGALAERTEDPALLIEVNYLLARADFESLRALEEEHPRWEEDDEVRPRRHALYHGIVDQFLWPHLFHATLAEPAARGLRAAAETHAFAGEPEWARYAYEDLLRLYPASAAAAGAAEALAEIEPEAAASALFNQPDPSDLPDPSDASETSPALNP